MSSKSKKPQKRVSMTKAVTVAMTIFVWSWMEVFHWWMEDGVLPGQTDMFDEMEAYDED